MPAVFFTNLALLGGLAALTIPIVIHLLVKRKKQRLRFSTIQFFVKQDEQASQRRKLRNWLLLAVRVLLVTLLVLAFARPFTRSAPTAANPTKRVGIFVVDRSLSMQSSARGESTWNAAMKLARTALRQFKDDDQAAIITCAAHTEVVAGLKSSAVIARLIDNLTPVFTSGDLTDGLRTALKVAATREPGSIATIYVVSDLQKNNAENLQRIAVPQDIEVKLLHAGDLLAGNVAVADLRLEGSVKPHAEVTLKSFSDEDCPDLKMAIVVDGHEVMKTSVSLKSGVTTNLILALPPLKPGWHSAEARLVTNDALKADDVRYHAFFIPEPLKVLCVETRTAARIHEQDTFFVASALQPENEPGNTVPALFTVEVTDVSTLVRRLAPGKDSSGYAAVILPALRQVPDNAGEALSAYVRNGGGLLVFLGDGLSANRYNTEFRDLLPLKLDSIDVPANAGWRMDTFEKASPMFTAFSGTAAPALQIPEFTRRFRLAPLGSAAAGSILATFHDAVPLITSRTVGAGSVILLNTSSDASWSDWPKRKSFVPWLHGTVNFLGKRSNSDAMQPSRVVTASADLEIVLGPQQKRRSFIVQRGEQKGEAVVADDEGRLATLNTEVPGAYSVRDAEGVIVQRWAVNVPSRESDLAAFSPQEFSKQLVRSKSEPGANLQASLFGATKGEREWWRVLLLAALGLLFAEVFLANRTRA